MKKLITAYYYLFYQLYKWYEKGPSIWWSDWKAGISIMALEIWFIACIINYYLFVFNSNFLLVNNKNYFIYFIIVLVLIPNYFLFVHTDKWKDYVREFDQLPNRTNRIGGWIVFGVVIFIFSNLIFSFYLYYQT